MRPPANFNSFNRVRRDVRRSGFNPRVSGLHVNLLLLFHFGAVRAFRRPFFHGGILEAHLSA